MPRHTLGIGDVARATGVRATTIRSWERYGLLQPKTTRGGRRRFGPDDMARVTAIDRMRRVQGFNLRAIRDVLAVLPTPFQQNTAPIAELGMCVRARRLEQGLSLRELAKRAALAASYLSTFERGAANPSTASLSRLADALRITLADLLGHAAPDPSGLIASGTGRRLGLGPLVEVEQLTVGEALMDAEIWTLAAGAESDGAYAHEGEELIHVLKGQMEIGLDPAPMRSVGAGDSLYFASGRPHRWRNPGPEPAQLLWANTDRARLSTKAAANASAQPSGVFPDVIEAFSRSYRVIDSHTAGHPTRVVLDLVADLPGKDVRAKRAAFAKRYDHLRGTLLHEPRGHAATFGVVLVPSASADFGAIFISSYDYLDMCGHGVIGLARTLRALGRLEGKSSFTLETPAGLVDVRFGPKDARDVTFTNVSARLLHRGMTLGHRGRRVEVDVAYGGVIYALVEAAAVGLRLARDQVGRCLEEGAALKDAVNCALTAAGDETRVESVLFHEDLDRHAARHLVVLAANKFDRSPCGTGTSARLAQLHAMGRLNLGDAFAAEGITGARFSARIAGLTGDGIVPEITGRAHITGFSTLVIEEDDPLEAGFLYQ